MTNRNDLLVTEANRLLGHIHSGRLDRALAKFSDWAKASVPKTGQTGGGMGDASSDDAKMEQLADRQAGRYQHEATTLLKRIADDLQRLDRLVEIGNPPQPRQIAGKEMLSAQIAAEGWCVSCWRWNQTVKEREKNSHGHFHDKEACDLCADFKREHGIYPPLTLLQAKHGQLKNWTSKMVADALDEARRPKAKAS